MGRQLHIPSSPGLNQCLVVAPPPLAQMGPALSPQVPVLPSSLLLPSPAICFAHLTSTQLVSCSCPQISVGSTTVGGPALGLTSGGTCRATVIIPIVAQLPLTLCLATQVPGLSASQCHHVCWAFPSCRSSHCKTAVSSSLGSVGGRACWREVLGPTCQ